MAIKKYLNKVYRAIPEYYRNGAMYRKYYKLARGYDRVSREQFDQIQLNMLKETLKYCGRYVPYYKELFSKYKFDPSLFTSFSQLHDLPILDKKVVQENIDKLTSVQYEQKKIVSIYSGGSTGVPAEYRYHRDIYPIEKAFMHFQWGRVGFNPKRVNKIAILRGIKPKRRDFEILGDKLILSSYIADKNQFDKYLSVLECYNPDYLHAYPSILYMWSKYINDKQYTLNLSNLRAIFLGSENLYDFQRSSIERAFKVRVYTWYGHTEKGCLAGECETSNSYHIFPHYGYSEVLGEYDEQGEKRGQLIVTSYLNKVMPLIRFNTEDIVILSDSICDCGRGHRLIKKVDGRTSEYLLDLNGKVIPANVLLPYELIDLFRNVTQYRFVQKIRGFVDFLMVVKDGFDKHQLTSIENELTLELGPSMTVSVIIVNDIPRTVGGKFSFLDTKERVG